MGDSCISLNVVKPGFLPAATALNRNGDDKVCKSENPRISKADFEAFVNTIRIKSDIKEAPAIEIPEMIAISEKLSIMKREVAVGLFKQVMDGHEIKSEISEQDVKKLLMALEGKLLPMDSKLRAALFTLKFKAILSDPSKVGETLTYVSLYEAREFASRLSKLTGRKFRVQTEAEWEAARDRLSGDNWTWTETKKEFKLDLGNNKELKRDTFILRNLSDNSRINDFSGIRENGGAIRLVEDL